MIIHSLLINSGLPKEQIDTIMKSIGNFIGMISAIIVTAEIFVLIWVSTRIAKPLTNLATQLRSQKIGQILEKIKIKRSFLDKDDEINEVIYTLNSNINRINELELKKEDFLSMITHELKDPITPIMGFAQALQKPEILGELTPEQIHAVKAIIENASNLRNIIIELLDAQKIDLEKMNFEYINVNVNELIKNLENHLQNLLNKKQIQFDVNIRQKIYLVTDRHRLEQVLNNLILNAIDFVPEKSAKITLDVQDKEDHILFSVKDNGKGIPLELQKGLFKKFNQVDRSISRKHKGIGLGLFLSDGIITKLGGKIWVESEIEKGTTFFFTIPKVQKNNGAVEH